MFSGGGTPKLTCVGWKPVPKRQAARAYCDNVCFRSCAAHLFGWSAGRELAAHGRGGSPSNIDRGRPRQLIPCVIHNTRVPASFRCRNRLLHIFLNRLPQQSKLNRSWVYLANLSRASSATPVHSSCTPNRGDHVLLQHSPGTHWDKFFIAY